MEVFPFTKIVWKSPEIQRSWEPLRRRIYGAANYAEYEMVKQGYRVCDVYQLDPDKFDWQIKRVMLDGLVYLPILRSKTYGGYGHRHYHTDIIDKDTFIYGVVAKTLNDAVEFHDAGVVDVRQRIKKWKTEEMNPNGIDHDVTGRLLGYPKCCRDFFSETWLRDGCLDPMYEMAENTYNHEKVNTTHIKVEGVAYLNRLIRYWGFNLIPFFPHSFDCPLAKEFAEVWFKLMLEKDEEAANACLEALNMPMMWSMSNCVTTINHPLFYGSANGYYRPEKVIVEWFPI